MSKAERWEPISIEDKPHSITKVEFRDLQEQGFALCRLVQVDKPEAWERIDGEDRTEVATLCRDVKDLRFYDVTVSSTAIIFDEVLIELPENDYEIVRRTQPAQTHQSQSSTKS